MSARCAMLIEVSLARDMLSEFTSIKTTVYFAKFKLYRSVDELKAGAAPITEFSAYMDYGKLCTEVAMYKNRGCRVFLTAPSNIKISCPNIRFE